MRFVTSVASDSLFLPHFRPAVASSVITAALKARLAERLDIDPKLAVDLPGLFTLYGAWCRNVPFDNVRKLITLRTGTPGALPGTDAVDFLEHFLAHGTGGTCWSSSNALYHTVKAFGFDARRVAGSMRDTGIPGHGSVKVAMNGSDWLVDSSMLTMFPVPISSQLYAYRDPQFGVEVEPFDDGTHMVWFSTPPYEDYFPCRLMFDPVAYPFYVERYEISRDRGPFNHHLSVRYNRRGLRTVIQGHTRHRHNEKGELESKALTRDELVDALRSDVGMSAEMVDQWVRCGALDAAYEPPLVPPAAITVRPPSTRHALAAELK